MASFRPEWRPLRPIVEIKYFSSTNLFENRFMYTARARATGMHNPR